MKTSIEQALKRLEEIVQTLESEDVELEKSLKLFEEGVRLADEIKKKLTESELKVKKIIERAEGFELEDFEMWRNCLRSPLQPHQKRQAQRHESADDHDHLLHAVGV